ncbi:MAG: tRNA (adenosine(37)-N6)-threonylcarbamoyltransferase complex dimerization subunit type 1 TsaB [Synergistaceae bacterium]|jgi:tRNA threonylcarbamoyladenosine biosynthesis protein TsaB|nr:tRNA (adenosine(37)-N6)-threonylcarbamoyltransferase complex dimerization subunit type 1 TsaB [Synergistaceae bacterium]
MRDALLAVDCSLRWTCAAVCRDDGDTDKDMSAVVSERFDLGRRQAAELPLVVDRVLEKAGCGPRDVALVAVTNGPGYFTGIRVGVSWATAFAYGLGIRVIPVSSLLMLAYPHLEQKKSALAIVYAGHDHVYAASFGCEDDLCAGEYDKKSLRLWLGGHKNNQDTVVVSDDPERACGVVGPFHSVQRTLPDAAVLARIARRGTEASVEPMGVRVSYHRPPQGYIPAP